MLTLNDGRSELWQWDTGRKLTVDAECSQVHFSNKVFGRSIDVDVVDGVASIPDSLLQTDKELTAWAYVGTAENGYTKISKVFKVNKRNKPADYVFTPTEQVTLDKIIERLKELEERPSGEVDPEEIKNIIDEYLQENPVEVEEKDPTIPAWAKETEKPKYTAEDVGAIPKNGDPKANVVFESVYCSDIVEGSELVVQNAQNNAEYASFVYGGKTQSGNPVVECGDMHGNPVNIRNVADPKHDSDVTPMRWVKDHVDKHGLKVSGAEVGQFLRVAAADENGVPTAWETAEFPAVGGEAGLIAEITIEEEVTSIKLNTKLNGEPMNEAGVFFITAIVRGSTANTEQKGLVYGINGNAIFTVSKAIYQDSTIWTRSHAVYMSTSDTVFASHNAFWYKINSGDNDIAPTDIVAGYPTTWGVWNEYSTAKGNLKSVKIEGGTFGKGTILKVWRV